MNKLERQQTERYYVAYQRMALVCLLSAIAAGGFFLATIFGGVGDQRAFDGPMIIIALFVTSLLAVSLVTLRGRLWRRSAPQAQRVLRDEWTRRNRNRAFQIGFAVVIWAQLPLVLLMNRLASEPSYTGMAGLSMTLGIGAFFASYLYLGRQQGDG